MKNDKNLLPAKKSDNIFVQSNEFIQAKYKDNMSFWELLIFGKMCTMIDPSDTDFKDYKIYIKDLIDFSGVVKGGVVYQYVLEATERLKQREVSLTLKNEEGKEETLDTYLVVGRKILTHRESDENMYVKLTFHPDLKPFLLQLKRDFTKLDIRTYRFLHTSTSIRLYHILKQFYGRKKIHPKLNLQELKEMLGVGDKYNPYNNFKQRVLDDAQKRLVENTDIKFEYEEVKERKKVVGLIFHISDNQPELLKDSQAEQLTLDETPATFFDEMFAKVEQWGISKEVLSLLIDTQPEEAIRNSIDFMIFEEKQGKIKENKAGFFINAVKNRYTSPVFEESKKKEQKAKEVKSKTETLAQLKTELKVLNTAFQNAINEKIREATSADATITNRAIENVKKNNSYYFTLKKVDPEQLDVEVYRKDKILRGLVIQEIQLLRPELFEAIHLEYMPQLKNLEMTIKQFGK